MAGKSDLYFARRPFTYGRPPVALDRGQVIELLGMPNDEKLTRLGYFMKMDTRVDPSECGDCGAKFVGDAERAAHGSDRHTERELDPVAEEEREARRERRMEQEAPLFVENSRASKAIGGKRVRVPT